MKLKILAWQLNKVLHTPHVFGKHFGKMTKTHEITQFRYHISFPRYLCGGILLASDPLVWVSKVTFNTIHHKIFSNASDVTN